ncbi:YesK family protein [Bacillus pumilus]|uniref:YesK family protein n=1 Tax=Bacillus pumilus TaxID=1408 RepID=UPI0021B1B4F3|nr:YesK family protein [Bacillus pumilus]
MLVSIILLLTSFFLGGWEGLGLGAISVSLLVSSVITFIITSILNYFSGMKQK